MPSFWSYNDKTWVDGLYEYLKTSDLFLYIFQLLKPINHLMIDLYLQIFTCLLILFTCHIGYSKQFSLFLIGFYAQLLTNWQEIIQWKANYLFPLKFDLLLLLVMSKLTSLKVSENNFVCHSGYLLQFYFCITSVMIQYVYLTNSIAWMLNLTHKEFNTWIINAFV